MNHSTIQSVNQSVVQSFYQSAWVSLSIRRLVDDGSVNKSVSLHFSCMFVCPYFCPSFYLSRSVCLSLCQSSSLPFLPSVSLYANYFPSCQFYLCSPIRRLLSDPWGSSPDLRCHTSTPVSTNTDTNSLSSEKHGQVPQAAKQDSDFQILLFLCTIYNTYNIKGIQKLYH